jgi:hypothetical protein
MVYRGSVEGFDAQVLTMELGEHLSILSYALGHSVTHTLLSIAYIISLYTYTSMRGHKIQVRVIYHLDPTQPAIGICWGRHILESLSHN